MYRQDIDIDGYWTVIVVYNVWLGKKNTGFTHTDFTKRLSIVGISEATSDAQFVDTVAHEIKHVQSHICRYYNVSEDGEQAAYLTGYLMNRMYRFFEKFLGAV